MGKLLKQFSEEMRTKFGMNEEVKPLFQEKVADPLKRYQEAFENKESFEVKFEQSGKDGTLSCIDNYGIKIVLDGDYLRKDLPYYEEANKASFIGVDFVVKIEKVDEAEGVVYVRSAYSNSQTTRQRLIREILSEVNKEGGEMLVLPGRVINVSEKRAMIDLLGKGILGIINVNDWQVGYVRHLPKTIHKGEVYDFVVEKPLSNSERHRSLAFRLTRVPITEDPWEAIKKTNPDLAVDSVLTVKCIAKPSGKSYWWGISPMINGIEIMGDYSSSVARPYVGVTYKCRVKRYDPDQQKLQVVPFDIIDTAGGSKEAVKFISTRGKKNDKK